MRNANFQTVAWFWDLFQRGLLDLDPPYQRRSVWNQPYKDLFIDTVLNGFPAPAIFIFQEISPDGGSRFSVVDGKQRLSTLFEFAKDRFPIAEDATIANMRGKYFQDLDNDVKKAFWGYQFSVEYLPSSDEKIINTVFDRINRNVAKLTPQELRHAKFDGEFIATVEDLNEWMFSILPLNFPMISQRSRKQMKDIEFTTQILLFLEEGPRSYSQNDLDKAFAERDEIWESKDQIDREFRTVIYRIKEIIEIDTGNKLAKSRLRNQADFYSFFGAIAELIRQRELPNREEVYGRLITFIEALESDEKRLANVILNEYYEAARSASNDPGPRKTRICIIKDVIKGIMQL